METSGVVLVYQSLCTPVVVRSLGSAVSLSLKKMIQYVQQTAAHLQHRTGPQFFL
jgi:hypothetical protein